MVSQEEVNGYFLEVVRWLKREFGYTQEYIVEKAQLAQNAITKIKKGKANAGDETIAKVCDAFKLNPDYFYGRSPYKTAIEKSEAKHDMALSKSCDSVPHVDESSQLNASLAAYVQLTNRLTDDLKAKEHELADRLADKDAIIREKDSRIVTLERTIADKDTIIRDRDARILSLERQIAASKMQDLADYPFTVGVSEQPHKQTNVK